MGHQGQVGQGGQDWGEEGHPGRAGQEPPPGGEGAAGRHHVQNQKEKDDVRGHNGRQVGCLSIILPLRDWMRCEAACRGPTLRSCASHLFLFHAFFLSHTRQRHAWLDNFWNRV